MKSFCFLLGIAIPSFLQAQDTIQYSIVSSGKQVGKHWVVSSAPNTYALFYEFNDRGRGPKQSVVLKTNENGLPIYREITGVDYFKAQVKETFEIKDGVARWKNNIEQGEKQITSPFLYSALNSTPAEIEWALHIALKNADHKVDVLPSGFLFVNHIKNHELTINGFKEEFALYEFSGAGGAPYHAWFTPKNKFFASVSSWSNVIEKGREDLADELYEAQKKAEHDYFEFQADKFTQTFKVPVVFNHATVFDAIKGKYLKDQAVIIENDKIITVGKSKSVNIPTGAKVIDASGKILMPGLWDNHAHYNPTQGLYHLAGGVTNIKDMANGFDLPETKKKVDTDELLGPEVSIMSGFIDFAGPFAGPTGKIVKTLEEGLEAVNFYADRGYQQVKLYSSIPPDWVKPLAAQAHNRGLKVCGHIPSFMTATRAVNDGYDQIMHMNMIMLNFMGDTVDTRSMGRFIKVAQRAKNIDLNSAATKQFIQLLKSKNIVVDPTLAIFEGMFTNDEGKLAQGYETIVNRFPAEFRRGLYSGGLPTRKGHEADYNLSFDKMLKMLKLLFDNKITFVPGTDDFPGFALHRELELYVKAGVPNAKVLQSATIVSARVAGKEKEFGSIEVGKKANLILIDGDPLKNISNIRNVELVMKNGNLYDPKAMYQSYGFGFWK
ncbi:MAG: amidohydrolase family protein [Bacteroidetes bacterium]|nr:amidohydrolase family protein [Bacteroidota bacterium]MBI3482179.1 amidohydrolase family protein [Bacteroidota bacterium]